MNKIILKLLYFIIFSSLIDAKEVSDWLKNNYPEITTAILQSDSMDNKEKKYWSAQLPSMKERDIEELRDILCKERESLNRIRKLNSTLTIKVCNPESSVLMEKRLLSEIEKESNSNKEIKILQDYLDLVASNKIYNTLRENALHLSDKASLTDKLFVACSDKKTKCKNQNKICSMIKNDALKWKYHKIGTYRNENKNEQLSVACMQYSKIFEYPLNFFKNDNELKIINTEECHSLAKFSGSLLLNLCYNANN